MDSARFQTVFDLRDRIKSEAGVGASCERLTGLNTERPGDPAIQLNLGIALFESGRIPEAMPIFQNLVADAKEMLPGVWLEKAVFYLGLCQLPLSAEAAIKSVATSLGLVSDEGKKNLINLTVDRLVNTKSIAFLLRTLDPAQWAGNVGPAQARRLFELASAAGIAELFDE